jgi:hypothetical protein
MKERLEITVGAILASGVTLTGLDHLLRTATSLVGFLTALAGLATGVLIFVWWYRKVKKQ